MEEKKKCNTCKKEKLNTQDWFMVIAGFYMLTAAIYGTIHFVKHYF
jgi:hypothetical protein